MSITPPSNSTFGASFKSSINGDYGSGVLTGIASGTAAVVCQKLNLSGVSYVTYSAISNANFTQTGCVRFKLTPTFDYIPHDTQSLFSIIDNASTVDVTNALWLYIENSGAIKLYAFDSSDSAFISAETLGTWHPNGGIEYEFELNCDFTTGATRLFIDGVQFGSTITETGTRTSIASNMQIGKWIGSSFSQAFMMRDLEVFITPQHDADYVPGYEFPEDIVEPEEPEPEEPQPARDFYDEILAFISTSSLTDAEYEAMGITTVAYTQSVYDALSAVLLSRDSVSTTQARLDSYFEAAGVSITAEEVGRSNIFVGGDLC